MEHALILTGQFEPFSVVGVLRLLNGPTPERLRLALDQLQQEQPMLNMTTTGRGRQICFSKPASPSPIPLQIEQRQDETQWQKIAVKALNTAVDIHSAPLIRCIYLIETGENGAADLIFVYHHAIMDAASSVWFYHRLLSLCESDAVDLPGDIHSLQPEADALLPAEMQGVKRAGHLFRDMARQLIDEIQYRRQLGHQRQAPLHSESTINQLVTRKLDRAATKAIVRRSRQERVSMNSIVSTAMLLSIHKHLYHSQPVPLRPLSFANLRPYLSPPVPDDYFGCYIALLRTTIFCEAAPDFWETARCFQTALIKTTAKGGKFTAMIMSKQLMKVLIRFQSFRMGTTAVSYPGPLNLQPNYGSIQLTNVHGFISNHRLGPEFVAFAKILFGELSWDFLYLEADMDRALADTLADEVIHLLETNAASNDDSKQQLAANLT